MRSEYEDAVVADSDVSNTAPETDHSPAISPANNTERNISSLLRQIAKEDFGPGDANALETLVFGGRYLATLVDPAFLPLVNAQRAADRLHKADPNFLSRFPKLTNSEKPVSTERLLRALEIVEFLGDYGALLFWIRGLYKSPHLKVKSKAAKLFYRLRQTSDLLSEPLVVLDDRARANAVEALWKSDVPWAGDLFRQALHDPTMRVVLNALIGLYYLNDTTVFRRLALLSRHASPQTRASVVWVLCKLASPPAGEERAKKLLYGMSNDPAEEVRSKVEKAIRSLAPAEASE